MPSVSHRISALMWILNGGKIRRCLDAMANVHGPRLAQLADDELVQECVRVIDAPKLGSADAHGSDLWRRLRGGSLGEHDAEALALAREAFSRFPPAGLPRGSALTDEQVLAAAHLASASLVQMDTGEGKTFALSTAAFALLRTCERVYIITANDYLASRDATQAQHFWSSVGVSVGLGLETGPSSDSDTWRARIVYTTLSALEFRSLYEDVADEGTARTLVWSAVLLDEADAVLLDQSDRRHSLSRSTSPNTKDWSEALRIAEQVGEEHIMPSGTIESSARLTAAGEQHVAALTDVTAASLGDRLMLLNDVELAYTATRVAREGHEYEVRSGRVVAIDPETGWPQRGITPSWLPALEQARGLPARPRTVNRDAIAGMPLLWRFEHMAGASGTVIGEMLDYMLLVGLPCVVIRPRVPRHEGRLPDVHAVSREVAHKWVGGQVKANAVARPILIATHSMRDAHALVEELDAVMPAGSSVRAVTGRTIAEERVFERAGTPGVTIVSTRVAGRGVDIRLSPEARAAGGTLLIALGHSFEARLDRQLLGRVGRTGDPYAARFVNHPDDPFMRAMARQGWMKKSISMAAEGVIESPIFSRQIAQGQRRLRRHRLGDFAGQINAQMAEETAYELLRTWRRALPLSTEDVLPAAFIETAVSRFVAARFPGVVFESPDVVLDTENVASQLATLVGSPEDRVRLKVETTGQPAGRSREILTRYVSDALVRAMEENVAARERLREQREVSERAVVDVRLLRFIRALLDEPGVPTTAGALQSALALELDEGSVEVSSDTRTALLSTIAQGLVKSKPGPAMAAEPRDLDLSTDAALAELVASAADLVLESSAGSAEAAERLRAVVDRAHTARAECAQRLDGRWRDQARRSPWGVPSETMDHATQRLLTGLDRTRFELSQTLTGPAFYRMYRLRVAALCSDVEATLSAEMIGNLLAAREPAALDDLLAEREHAIATFRPPIDDGVPALTPRAVPRTAVPAPAEPHLLVEHFLEAMRQRMGKEAPDDRLVYPVLSELMQPAGTAAVLTDPDRVAATFAAYKKGPARERIAPWHRRRVDKQVRRFFAFLHERGLAAPLPTGVVQRSESLLRRAKRTFSATGVGLGLAALLAAGALCVVLSLLPRAQLDPVAADVGLLDRMLSGGALTAGSALGPVLLAIVGAAWVRWLSGAPITQDAGRSQLERLAAPVLLAIGVLALVRPGRDGIDSRILLELAGAVLLFAAGSLVRGFVWSSETMVHFHLTAGLAAGFACLALPYLADLSSLLDVAVIFVLTAAVMLASLPLRRVRIPVVAMRVGNESSATAETMVVPLAVRAPLSIVPHASALLLAWVGSCVALDADPLPRALVAAAVYMLVLGLWASVLSRSATDVEAWREGMRSRHRAYEGTPAHGTLEEALAATRRRLMTFELAAVVPLVAVGTVIAAGLDAAAVADVPVGVAAIATSVFAVELGRGFVNGFRLPLAGAPASGSANEASMDEAESFTTYAQAVVRPIVRRLGFVVLIVAALSRVADARDVGDLAADIVRWVLGLFG